MVQRKEINVCISQRFVFLLQFLIIWMDLLFDSVSIFESSSVFRFHIDFNGSLFSTFRICFSLIQLNRPIRWVIIWTICCEKLKIASKNWAALKMLHRLRIVHELHFPVLSVSFIDKFVSPPLHSFPSASSMHINSQGYFQFSIVSSALYIQPNLTLKSRRDAYLSCGARNMSYRFHRCKLTVILLCWV